MNRPTLPALILAAGVLLAGLAVGIGFARGRADSRYVTVKGVSEREVRADLAIWPLRLVAASNDLAEASRTLRGSEQRLRAFLARQGIDSSQISVQDFQASDAYANQYGGDRITSRYALRQTVVVRSTDPAQILAASQRVAELVSAGVVLTSGNEFGGNAGPTFLFTALNDVKPQMIQEATARAREAAEQFARDSRTTLGGIRRANQGVFEILPRDQAPGISQESQIVKTVRVVSTVDYLLK
ncbi:MAG TPA: SIMPL domain-containing protein [Gemmatimonadaceae bacterium]|nr:SIMPL domain-containing protein [Gemmatimonadaceae bacterium]